jgi:hypothetical protein
MRLFCIPSGVAESRVDLEPKSSVSESNRTGDPHTFVLLIFLDPVRRDSGRIERQAVIGNDDSANLAHHFNQSFQRTVSGSEQVHVPGGPVVFGRPELKEDRSFQYEVIGVLGNTQPIEKPLNSVTSQYGLELPLVLSYELGQASLNRCRYVFWFPLSHTSVASR